MVLSVVILGREDDFAASASAKGWCNAKSEKEGLTPCYKVLDTMYWKGEDQPLNCDWNASGYRLPTEAEWEKAARGGLVGKKYPNGDSLAKSDANIEGSGTMEVGKYPANGYGLYDMLGNVAELCWDWYAPYTEGSDPRGAANGRDRVLRGGGWYGSSNFARGARRSALEPWNASNDVGFRLVRGRLQSGKISR